MVRIGSFNKTVYGSVGEKVNHQLQHNTNTTILFQRHWLQTTSRCNEMSLHNTCYLFCIQAWWWIH